MITGKTESGFAFSLPKAAIDNMELLDALADASDDDPVAVSRVCRLLLVQIFAAFGSAGKN